MRGVGLVPDPTEVQVQVQAPAVQVQEVQHLWPPPPQSQFGPVPSPPSASLSAGTGQPLVSRRSHQHSQVGRAADPAHLCWDVWGQLNSSSSSNNNSRKGWEGSLAWASGGSTQSAAPLAAS
jgi:hypothetical protein